MLIKVKTFIFIITILILRLKMNIQLISTPFNLNSHFSFLRYFMEDPLKLQNLIQNLLCNQFLKIFSLNQISFNQMLQLYYEIEHAFSISVFSFLELVI